MAKQFSRDLLKSLRPEELKQLAESWNISNPHSNKQKLEKQLYNHKKNNQPGHIINTDSEECNVTHVNHCVFEICAKHPQPEFSFKPGRKIYPTRFWRAPFPNCWFVAGCQLLSAIDWPAEFYEYFQTQQQELFSRILYPVSLATFEITGQIFKTVPSTLVFNESFTKWPIGRQQDATEFIVKILENISPRCRETPQSFFINTTFDIYKNDTVKTQKKTTKCKIYHTQV